MFDSAEVHWKRIAQTPESETWEGDYRIRRKIESLLPYNLEIVKDAILMSMRRQLYSEISTELRDVAKCIRFNCPEESRRLQRLSLKMLYGDNEHE